MVKYSIRDIPDYYIFRSLPESEMFSQIEQTKYISYRLLSTLLDLLELP